MKKKIGKTLCNYEQFPTNFCEIEWAINQRPLTYVPDEIYKEVLTRYHMILGRNIDDNCTINFNEIINDNVRANVMI